MPAGLRHSLNSAGGLIAGNAVEECGVNADIHTHLLLQTSSTCTSNASGMACECYEAHAHACISRTSRTSICTCNQPLIIRVSSLECLHLPFCKLVLVIPLRCMRSMLSMPVA